MSSLKFDLHTVCTDCRGIDCDLETRCIECTDVSDLVMQDYVSHKLSLKCKLLAKCKLKVRLCMNLRFLQGIQPWPNRPCGLY